VEHVISKQSPSSAPHDGILSLWTHEPALSATTRSPQHLDTSDAQSVDTQTLAPTALTVEPSALGEPLDASLATARPEAAQTLPDGRVGVIRT